MAAKQTRKRHPAAAPKSESGNGLLGELRARRQVPAIGPDDGGKREPVNRDDDARKMLARTSSHAFCIFRARSRLLRASLACRTGQITISDADAHRAPAATARNRRCALFALAFVGIRA